MLLTSLSFLMDLLSLNNIFDYYAEIPGVQINYIQSKAIWIDSKNILKMSITILAGSFTLNLSEIIKSNFDCTIKHVRNLTFMVLSRVTILKTLIIPQITYLLIALLNPPTQTKRFKQTFLQIYLAK